MGRRLLIVMYEAVLHDWSNFNTAAVHHDPHIFRSRFNQVEIFRAKSRNAFFDTSFARAVEIFQVISTAVKRRNVFDENSV